MFKVNLPKKKKSSFFNFNRWNFSEIITLSLVIIVIVCIRIFFALNSIVISKKQLSFIDIFIVGGFAMLSAFSFYFFDKKFKKNIDIKNTTYLVIFINLIVILVGLYYFPYELVGWYQDIILALLLLPFMIFIRLWFGRKEL